MNRRALWNAKGERSIQGRKPVRRSQVAKLLLMTAGGIMGAVLLIGAMGAPVCAQSYPNKPIRFVVPWPPGGPNDVLARIIGTKLTERLGQPVVLENRAGGGGTVGTGFVARATPDGHTIIIGGAGTHILPPILEKELSYDPIKDFAPIALLAASRYLMVVRSSLPIKNLKEFVEYAKKNPGKLNYGSGGVGSLIHLAGELFKSLAKIDIVHVAYKGTAPMLTGLISGEVDMGVVSVGVASTQIQAGKVRALAVLSNGRIASLPDVPTAKEAGIDNFEVSPWYGLLAPAGTPRDIINRLNAEWIKIGAMSDTKEQLQKIEADPTFGTPEQFSQFLKTELVRWTKVIKEANISK